MLKFLQELKEDNRKQVSTEEAMAELQKVIHEIQRNYGSPLDFRFRKKRARGGGFVYHIRFHLKPKEEVVIKCHPKNIREEVLPCYKGHLRVVIPAVMGGS